MELQAIKQSDQHITDDVWVEVFSHLTDAKNLVSSARTCKRFQKLITKNDHLWSTPLSQVENEYSSVFNSGDTVETNALLNYEKVVAFGKAIYSYKLTEDNSIFNNAFKKSVLETNMRSIFYLLSWILFICAFFIFLGLRLDNIVYAPPGTFFLLAVVMCVSIIYAIDHLYFDRSEFLTFLHKVILFTKEFSFMMVCFAASLLGLSIFSLIFYKTGVAQEGIWLFGGIAFALATALLFHTSLRSPMLQARFGRPLRVVVFIAFVAFVGGILLYAYAYSKAKTNVAYGRAFGAWVFSYALMVLASCCPITFGTSKNTRIYWFAALELLCAGLIFATLVMCHLNIAQEAGILWVLVFIPVYLLPCTLTLLCYSYSATSDVDEDVCLEV